MQAGSSATSDQPARSRAPQFTHAHTSSRPYLGHRNFPLQPTVVSQVFPVHKLITSRKRLARKSFLLFIEIECPQIIRRCCRRGSRGLKMSYLVDPGSRGSTSGAGNHTQGATCIWKTLLPEEDATLYPPPWYIVAASTVASVASCIYLMQTHAKSKLRKLTYADSYMLFKIFYFAMLNRVLLPKLCRVVLKNVDPEYIRIIPDCEEGALIESFLTVMEIEILTHVCINRYVVAKYIYNGWALNKNHIRMYLGLCMFFAFAYTLPPLFGMGKYGLDLDCETCSLDMMLPKRWKYFVLTIWFLRSVKPTMFMLVMLLWARQLEAKFTDQMKLKYDAFFTRVVELVTVLCLLYWNPMFLVRAYVIITQLIGDIDVPRKALFDYVMLLYEVTPVLVVIVITAANSSLADKQPPLRDVLLISPPQPDDKKEE